MADPIPLPATLQATPKLDAAKPPVARAATPRRRFGQGSMSLD